MQTKRRAVRVGAIYILLLFMANAWVARADLNFQTLVSFTGTNGFFPGALPEAKLVQGADGNLYGTTIYGGTNNLGTVFRTTTNGAYSTLVEFGNGTNGGHPQAGLIQGKDGDFYGTTGPDYIHLNSGVIFRISADGIFTNLVTFLGPNGSTPNGLMRATNGKIYGTTYYGGANGQGTVFEMAPNGILTTLYSFGALRNATGVALDGANPQAGLVQADDGALYGTTVIGGTNGDFGTVFRITTNGNFSSLVSFDGTNGANPLSTLVQGADGSLYGTTSAGGVFFSGPRYSGNGTLFTLSSSGIFQVLHYFAGYPDDGAAPSFVGLALGTDGSLFGTTSQGGADGSGTVFQRMADGGWNILHSFSRADFLTGTNADGSGPVAGVTQGNDGSLFGVALDGGNYGFGTVFRLSSPLWSLPRLQTIAAANGTILLTWPPLKGRQYQVQYKTELSQPDWSNEGSPVSTSDSIARVAYGVSSDTRRFYRVALLP